MHRSIRTLFLGILFASLPLFAGPEGTNRFGANLTFVGLTYHPGGGENEGYPRQLDDGAYWVVLLGLETDLDWYFHKYGLLRLTVDLNKDCADVWAGFFHLGPRLNVPIGPRFVFRIGIGPTILWRETWMGVVPGYTKDGFYGKATGSAIQSKFFWYGGNLDFEWKIRPNVSLLFSNIPGWPYTITSSFGARYSF